MKDLELFPRCHPAPKEYESVWHTIKTHGPIYNGAGYILPCCWCDYHETRDMEKHNLLDEELKLENNINIESIMLSKQWASFHSMLLNNPKEAPTHCKQRCSRSAIEEELKSDENRT